MVTRVPTVWHKTFFEFTAERSRLGGASPFCDATGGVIRVLTPQRKITVVMMLAAILIQGCAAGPLRLQYLKPHDEGLSYYVDKASAIEYPVESEERSSDPNLFMAPRSIRSLDEVDPREVTLHDCKMMAMSKGVAIRDGSSLGSPGNPILSRPAQAASILDPAIQSTGFLFGNRGYEAALADFDALATSDLTWGRDEVPQNALNTGVATPGTPGTLVQETFSWQSSLEKTFANGGTATLQADTTYDGNNRNSNFQRFPSAYTGLVQVGYRQPLWAGAGSEFTKIAGPLNSGLRGVSGVSQGVLISRINGDIALTNFEQSVATLVRDVEREYWDLSLALRLYESERDAFDDLYVFLQVLKLRDESGDAISQAEGRIHEADARMRGSLADVLDREMRLRRLCNLPLNDGQFLYPADLPSEGRLEPLWDASLHEALVNRVELRRQKWEIKSLELQLKAANSLTRPRLDGVMQYRVNALGDKFGLEADAPLETMLDNLTSGQNTGWSAGLQWSMPVGLRLAHTQVRNYEIRLRKAKAMLQEQEWEIAYELAGSFLEMQRWYELADGQTARIRSATEYESQIQLRVDNAEQIPPELRSQLLQAKIQKRDTRQGYVRSVIEYNKAIAEMRFRKGTTLTDSSIYLAEGNWHPAAAPIAMQRAIQRTRSKDAHRLVTQPGTFVGGPTPGAWESLGTDTRPSTPGAMVQEAELNPAYSEMNQNEPWQQHAPPMAPPADDILVPVPDAANPVAPAPMLIPSPTAPMVIPIPAPPRDTVTQTRALRQQFSRNSLAPAAGEMDFVDQTGF